MSAAPGVVLFSVADLRKYLIATDSTLYVVRIRSGELYIFWYDGEGSLFGITPAQEMTGAIITDKIFEPANFPMLVVHHGEAVEPPLEL